MLQKKKVDYPDNLKDWNRSFRNETLDLYKESGYESAIKAIEEEEEYIQGGVDMYKNDTTEEGIKNLKFNEDNIIFVKNLREEIQKLENSKI